jgi:two-component system, OmpR family, sensor histidine kinase BaeS
VSLRVRLALALGAVALVTAAAVAIAAPAIVGRGFARYAADAGTPGSGRGQGPGGGQHAQEIQQETTLTIIAVALAAAAGASLLGVLLARRFIRPLAQLEDSAAAVARGELERRSGLTDRSDELGSLGRSFDAMAASLERADDARRRFFQDAVHELKTPLTVIDATATAVLEGVYVHDDRHVETMRQQSRLLARIVDELRTVSLADEGALDLRREPVSVDELLAATVRGFQARADLAGVRLPLDAPPRLVVPADRDRLGQVLSALLDNALRHTPTGGAVSLRAVTEREHVRLEVQDTGPGVAAADIDHVFERLYRADRARDRSSPSSGLGLAIVAALVKAHGGSVGVWNAPGGGACFWVRLPTDEWTATGPAPRTPRTEATDS